MLNPSHYLRRCRFSAIVACATPLLTAGRVNAAPRIEAPQSTFSFGWRDAAETVTNRFVLRNTGDAPLLLTDIRVSCGCSRAEPGSRALAPGEKTDLEVRTSLRGMYGSVRKSVTVISNDPNTPYLTLWVEGEARTAVCLEPSSVSFGRVEPDHPPAPVTVRLVGYATHVTITAAASDNSAFVVSIEPSGRALVLQPPHLTVPGAHRSLVRVTLSDPAQPSLGLHLYAWMSDVLRIVPATLAFRPGNEPASTRLVIVRPGTAARFKILETHIDGGQGQTEALSRPDGSYHVALKQVIPDTLTTNAALVIRTDLAARPEWRVPLRIEGHAAPAPQ